ncbi:MAG: lipoprotein-releasing ABC transporter ATP-binding protein LolD [Gammaproteobacteria bacterium]|nr:lipoprotein-releasing ABC transporter ATP-binding protein LolD [Gammaproteobacteria bacterium]
MDANPLTPVVECVDVSMTYSEGRLTVDVLRDIDFSVNAGEQVAVVGTSGSGKSTLLHLLGGLAEPSAGRIVIDGQDINRLSQSARGDLRNRALGFVYQFHHLLPEFTALENVAMPLWIRKEDANESLRQAEEILVKVGLENRMTHKPGELSGGERQRAAMARALVTKPKCIMADEPTGNLDAKTAESIHQLMLSLNCEFNTSLIVVTHDMNLARKMERIVGIENGCIVNK